MSGGRRSPLRRRSIARRLALVLVVLAASVFAGGMAALRTERGARWIASAVMRREPRLKIGSIEGTLWRGVRLRDVSWRDGGTTIEIREFNADWRFGHRPFIEWNLARVRVDDLRVSVGPRAPDPADTPDRRPLWIPLRIRFEDSLARNVEFHSESLDVTWAELAATGRAHGKGLDLDSVRLTDLRINARPSGREITPAISWRDRLDPSRRQPVVPPDIRIPLDVTVASLKLERADFTLRDAAHHIETFEFAGALADHRLTVDRMDLHHAWGRVRAHGTAGLADGHPIDMNIRVDLSPAALPVPVAIEATISRSLADMDFLVHVTGPGNIKANGRIQPLDPSIPMNASVSWSNLAWPPGSTNAVASDSGRASVNGSLEACSIELSGDIRHPRVPRGTWSIRAEGDTRHVTIQDLHGDWLGGTLRATGSISGPDALIARAEIDARGLDASPFHGAAPTRIDAAGSVHGQWKRDDWQVNLDLKRAAANPRGVPLQFHGSLQVDSKEGWRTPSLTVTMEGNSVVIAGTYADEIRMSGTCHVPEPGRLAPGVSGVILGSWELHGPLNAPDIRASLRATHLAYRDAVLLSEARLEADIADGAASESRLSITLDTLSAPGRPIVIEHARLIATGSRTSHRLDLDVGGSPVSGSVSVRGSWEGPDPAWHGTVDHATVSLAGFDWSLSDPIPIRRDAAAHQWIAARHVWRHGDAEIRADEPLRVGEDGAIHLSLSGFDIATFHPWMPDDLRLRGTLNGSAALEWSGTGDVRAGINLGVLNGEADLIVSGEGFDMDAPPVVFRFDAASFSATMVTNEVTARVEMVSPELGMAEASGTVRFKPGRKIEEWTGTINLQNLKLEGIRPFIPNVRTLAGEIDASVRLSGEMRRPHLHGVISLTNGVVETAYAPVTLGGIHARMELLGDRAELSGGFHSGKGVGEITGTVIADADRWKTDLRARGDRLELAYGDIATLQISPDIGVQIDGRSISVDGTVLVPRAQITLRELPETAVRTSPDAVIEDPAQHDDAPVAADAESTRWARSIDIHLHLGNHVEFGGLGMSGRLAGRLHIRHPEGSASSAFGELRIEEGRYRAYGQRLEIRRGQFIFAGPMDQPRIELEAVRNVPAHQVIAGLRVEGEPDALKASLFSEPAMPEENILAFLLLGRPLDAGGQNSDGMMARAALSLGISRGGGMISAVGDNLGVTDLQVETDGDGEETQVVVRGMVSPRLQISYGAGVFARASTLTFRYHLARRLFLEAMSGLENALDLVYSFSF